MKRNYYKSRILVNNGYEGKSIEREVEEITTQNNPIEATSPIIYTERKDGVQPQYDIRTDRFEIAMEAMDKVSGSLRAKREEFAKQNPPKAEPVSTKSSQ